MVAGRITYLPPFYLYKYTHKATGKYMESKYISSYNIELIKETKIIQVVNDEQ